MPPPSLLRLWLLKLPPPPFRAWLAFTWLPAMVRSPSLKMPPPAPLADKLALLPPTELLVMVNLPPLQQLSLKMPPPTPAALLVSTVLFVSDAKPKLCRPPPVLVVLLLRVIWLPFTVSEPPLRTPPPSELAVLLITWLLFSVVTDPLSALMPAAPPLAVLPLMRLLFTVSAPWFSR